MIYSAVWAKVNGRPRKFRYSVIGRNEAKVQIESLSDDIRNAGLFDPYLLISVMKGHLSLVGTTIVLSGNFERFSLLLPGFYRKFQVKPGIIAEGNRYNEPLIIFENDLRYISQASLLGDLIIFLKYSILSLLGKYNGTGNVRG